MGASAKTRTEHSLNLDGIVGALSVRHSISIVALVSLLTACASGPYTNPDADDESSAPVENRAVVDGDVLPLPESPSLKPRAMGSDAPASPVVKKLMSSAQSQRAAGNFEGAANSLERALRIEPRNAKLWSRLADLRYAQKLWQKSIQMAKKSNTLVGSNRGLRRQNWYLIANAYTALGDSESSRKYREKLRE